MVTVRSDGIVLDSYGAIVSIHIKCYQFVISIKSKFSLNSQINGPLDSLINHLIPQPNMTEIDHVSRQNENDGKLRVNR